MSRLSTLGAALVVGACAAFPLAVGAKLPAPTPEAKAKADEAKNKAAWTDKVAAYQLCQSQDRVAAHYLKAAGKGAKSATAMPPCADPGAYVPLAAASAPPVVAAASAPPPLEQAGAHSPPKTAATPYNTKATDAEQKGLVKK